MGLKPKVGKLVTFYIHEDYDKNPVGEPDELGFRLYEGEVVDITLQPNFEHNKMVNCYHVKRLSDGFIYYPLWENFDKYISK